MLERPVPMDGVQPIQDWGWAQERTNFAIVVPRKGSAWVVSDATVRGESHAHYATVRYMLADAAGRRVRAKQYFNDWWIPTIPDVSLRTGGRAIVHREGVAFAGRDYRRHDGCCGHRFGTAVEFSADVGPMADADWTELWNDLEAAVPASPAAVRRSSYARRHYWNRWGRTEAPWNTRELSSLTWSDPTGETMARAAWALTADRWAPVPGTIDSIGFHNGAPHGEEVQMVFRWPMSLDASAWLRVLRAPPAGWRPLIDASEVNRPSWTRHEVRGHAIDRAAMNTDVGNWFFAWRVGALAYELHLRAQKGLDATAAERVVQGLVA